MRSKSARELASFDRARSRFQTTKAESCALSNSTIPLTTLNPYRQVCLPIQHHDSSNRRAPRKPSARHTQCAPPNPPIDDPRLDQARSPLSPPNDAASGPLGAFNYPHMPFSAARRAWSLQFAARRAKLCSLPMQQAAAAAVCGRGPPTLVRATPHRTLQRLNALVQATTRLARWQATLFAQVRARLTASDDVRSCQRRNQPLSKRPPIAPATNRRTPKNHQAFWGYRWQTTTPIQPLCSCAHTKGEKSAGRGAFH